MVALVSTSAFPSTRRALARSCCSLYLNQLVTSQDAGGTTTFTYDGNGNQTVIQKPNGDRTTQIWDYENRLVKTIQPSGGVTSMAYDADGLRLKKEDATGTKLFVWDDQNYLAETDAVGTTQAAFTTEPSTYGSLISHRKDGATTTYHFDAMGSTRALTDASEAVLERYNYTAFGTLLGSPTLLTPFLWGGMVGYYWDNALATQYIRARHYQPTIARWISLDPIGFAGGDANLFRYVGNSPTSGGEGRRVRLSATAYGRAVAFRKDVYARSPQYLWQFMVGRKLEGGLSMRMNEGAFDPSGLSVSAVDVLEFFTSPNHDLNSVIARIVVSTSVDTSGCITGPCMECDGNSKVTVKWKWIGNNAFEQPFDAIACIGTDCSEVLVSFDEHTIQEGVDAGKKMEGRYTLSAQRSFDIPCGGGMSAGDMKISRLSLRDLHDLQIDESNETVTRGINNNTYFNVSYRVRIGVCGKIKEDSVSVSESLNQIHFGDSWPNLIPPLPPGGMYHGPHWQWPPTNSGPEPTPAEPTPVD